MTEQFGFPDFDGLASINEPLARLVGPQPTPPAAEALLTSALLTNQFACVYDHLAEAFVFVSAGVAQLLGQQPTVGELTADWFVARLHPADAPAVAQAQALLGQYLHARPGAAQPGFLFSLDYRLRHADSTYRRVLHECRLLELEPKPEPGPSLRTLTLFTDITHHKRTHEVRFHVSQPDFLAFVAQHQRRASVLSGREQQILTLVLQGLTSKQIAYQLRLRESTVKAHRRNLLRKTATHNFHELLLHLAPPTT